MIERVITCICLTGIAALAIAAPLIGQRLTARPLAERCQTVAPCEKNVTQLVADLNAIVQNRFRDVDALGMARVIVTLHTNIEPIFRSDPADLATLCGFLQHRTQVVLYLAGRDVLRHSPGPEPHDNRRTVVLPGGRTFEARGPVRPYRVLSPAIRVAPDPAAPTLSATDLPDRERVASLARAVFATGRSTADDRGWRMVGEPVVAASSKCLDCHNTSAEPPPVRATRRTGGLNIGDTLGAVIYATRAGE